MPQSSEGKTDHLPSYYLCMIIGSPFSEFFFLGFLQGTNFKFKSWEMFRIHVSSSDQLYITLEATDPATGSVFSFQTVLFDYRRRSSLGVRTFWLNLTSRIEPLRKNINRIYSGLTLFR